MGLMRTFGISSLPGGTGRVHGASRVLRRLQADGFAVARRWAGYERPV